MTRDPSVVVVAYGSEDLLVRCVEPLAGEFHVVVVDNAGREECRRTCEQLKVDYVRAEGNLGFAGGVNLALERLDPKSDVLLLNPDAWIGPDGLRRLSLRLREGTRTACVAPAQRSPDGAERQRVAWPFPSPAGRWVEAAGLGRLRRRPHFLVGSVLLVAREALDDVGPFDERFFLYCEETDWQRRARGAGWHFELVEEVVAEHVGGATSSSSELREAFFHAGQEIYVRKWFGRRGWRIYRGACIGGDLVRLTTGRARARAARARIAIYVEGPVDHRGRVLEKIRGGGGEPR